MAELTIGPLGREQDADVCCSEALTPHLVLRLSANAMLSHSDIEERITSGEIKLFYHFLPNVDGTVTFYPDGVQVNPAEPSDHATQYFRRRLSANRLGITLGPIIRSHGYVRSKGRPAFRGRKNYADIRETENVLELMPHETVSVASNERFVFGPRTAALLIPRITLADAGIALTVAYIDAYWDGTLQMIINNSTPYVQRLSFLEPIAQCMFFALSRPADARFGVSFPLKSHHYGQTWRKVIEENAEPFPRRKEPLQPLRGLPAVRIRMAELWAEYSKWLTALGLSGTLLLAAVVWGRFSKDLEEAASLHGKLQDQESKVTALAQAATALRSKLPVSGAERLTIRGGARRAETTVELKEALSGSSSAWTQSEPEEGFTTRAIIESVGQDRARVRLIVSTAFQVKDDTTILIRWVVIP